MRLCAIPVAEAGGPAAGGAVLAASDTADIDHTTHRLGWAITLAGVIVVVLAALVAALLTRRTLRPLSRLAAAAEEIERTADPSRRLPEDGADSGSRDEVAQLTGVLNRMLASLEQARAGERRLLADASHELRTPITALLGNVEYAGRHGADAEVLADLRLDAERVARLVDSLLALERVGQSAPRLSAVSLADVAEALQRAVANLVENALLHGPDGGPVTVVVTRVAGEGRVAVSDAGPGPGPQDGERVFERFWRERDASGRPGSGLGLSIVAAIAAAHAGSVTVDGATFTLALPAWAE